MKKVFLIIIWLILVICFPFEIGLVANLTRWDNTGSAGLTIALASQTVVAYYVALIGFKMPTKKAVWFTLSVVVLGPLVAAGLFFTIYW